MTMRIRDTARSSGDKIPQVAPYNFGINVEWYERYKVTHGQWIRDRFQHPDPPGFGTNKDTGLPPHALDGDPQGASGSSQSPQSQIVGTGISLGSMPFEMG